MEIENPCMGTAYCELDMALMQYLTRVFYFFMIRYRQRQKEGM